MTEFTHTPGTWHVSKNDYRVIFSSLLTGGDTVVAVCESNSGIREVVANASLISAAPDMLEALENARRVLIDIQQRTTTVLRDDIKCSHAIAICDSAIAKANGETT